MEEIESVVRGDSRWCVVEADSTQVYANMPLEALEASIVTDPPYGIGASGGTGEYGKRKFLATDGKWDEKAVDVTLWLSFEGAKLFWGGNYFPLPPSRGFLVWNKGNGFAGRDFAECEMAWTNRDANARIFTYDPLAFGDYRHKEHPTQKPIPVMVWCITYLDLPPNSLIIDPFAGSGSTGVAAVQLGHRFIGIEREAKYCEVARRRIADAAAQGSLFNA